MSLLIDACYTWGTADHTTGTATSSSPHHRYHYHQHQQHALATTRHAPISQFTKRLTFPWARFWRIHTAVRTFSTNQNPDTPLRAASSPFAMNTNKPSCCSWNEILRILMTIDLHQSTSIMTQWNRTRSSATADTPRDAPSTSKLCRVTQGVQVIRHYTIENGVCKFLLVFHCNYVSILYCFRDTPRNLSEIATCLRCPPPVQGTTLEFCHNISCGKTRMMWLPEGEQSFRICLAVSTQHTNVTNRQTASYRATA